MKKLMAIAVALALLLTMSVSTPVAASTVWQVHPDTTPGATPIQDAVDAADPGDTIIVHKGIYEENVEVNVPNLTLRTGGNKNNRPIVDGGGEVAFLITADGVIIDGFQVRSEDSDWVIRVWSADNVIISNNNVSGPATQMIMVESADNVIVRRNEVSGGGKLGIGLDEADGCKVINNRVSSPDGIGIRVKWSSTGSVVQGNKVYDSSNGIMLVENANDNSIIGNVVVRSTEKGISVFDESSGNLIKWNLAWASGEYDLFWEGTGIGNIWEKNIYQTSNLP